MSVAERIVYLDNSSTTRAYDEVIQAMASAMDLEYGNPSSLHRLGSSAHKKMEESRNLVASLIAADAREIYFTSGGTEANNWALFGTLRALAGRGRHLVVSAFEHPSVEAAASYLESTGYSVTYVRPDAEGFIDPNEVLGAARNDTVLISVMLVQNEIGTIQPVWEIGRRLREMGLRRPRLHVDAVQGFARLPINPGEWGVDLMSLSAHKIHGPKGIGALFVRRGIAMEPFILGGGQESSFRSGTENMPGIIGFGRACSKWLDGASRENDLSRLARLRVKFIQGVKSAFDDAVLHGTADTWSPGEDMSRKCVPWIVHFSFPGFRGETILHALEQRGVYVSTGSACSSHKAKPSPVIMALGRGEDEALSSIRFSFSRFTTEEEIDYALTALEDALRELMPWRQARRR